MESLTCRLNGINSQSHANSSLMYSQANLIKTIISCNSLQYMVREDVKLAAVHITASLQFAHKRGALNLVFPSLVPKVSYLSHKTNAVYL